jgi:hypothetical protein
MPEPTLPARDSRRFMLVVDVRRRRCIAKLPKRSTYRRRSWLIGPKPPAERQRDGRLHGRGSLAPDAGDQRHDVRHRHAVAEGVALPCEREVGRPGLTSYVAEHPRCEAVTRDGARCRSAVVSGKAFCPHHLDLVAEFGEEGLRTGSYGTRRRNPETPLVAEAMPAAANGNGNGAAISPSEVRPRLAAMTAESVSEIQQALLDAAVGSTREHWTTFTCPDSGKKHRAQVHVPDVRARVGAIEVCCASRSAVRRRPTRCRLPACPEAPRH